MYRIIAFVAGAILIAGCTARSMIEVPFHTEPRGATVKLDTGQSCITPCVIELPAGRAVGALFSRPGCDQGLNLFRVTPWADGNSWAVVDVVKNKTYNLRNWWRIDLKGCKDKET